MKRDLQSDVRGEYALATGEAATHRLRVLHDLYGPGARRVLLRAGLERGMRVADLGCGVGMVTTLLAELVGPDGQVVGADASGEQIARARELLPPGVSNVSFIEASAADTGLPAESFDLVYCRFLLLHLTDPEQALREMHRLLRRDGILVCEDGDLTSAGSHPPSALDAFADLWGRLGPVRGLDYTIGRELFRMILAAKFSSADISFNQPVVARGENKRFLELSVAEAGPAFLAAGLVTHVELARLLTDMQRIAEDETVLALMPRMSQVWARKLVPSASPTGADAHGT
jgi:SAM-dependent methyltransferase